MDYFYIVYQEGFKYLTDIEQIIKNNFILLNIIDLKINKENIDDFFYKNLYINEPKTHISNKINYLVQNLYDDVLFEIKIIIVRDNNECFFIDRGTKKNKNIENVKRDIRNKFNPKFTDKTRQILPLNIGVSHNHIIHSSDLPDEFYIIKNIITKYKKFNIYKADIFHHKNDYFLNYFLNKHHNIVNNIDDSDIIISGSKYINNTNLYHHKRFILGPHFGKERINEIRSVNNSLNNSIYIQPSIHSVKLWIDEYKFTNLPMKAIPFGVDTYKFNCVNKIIRDNIIVYYKSRDPSELKLLIEFLNNKNLKYKIFSYRDKYREDDFLSYLKTCKFGIVLGRHESQGFAIEEMLSCNVPLLVWGVTLRKQEYPYRIEYKNILTPVSTVPYWSDKCGELFYNFDEIENKYKIFIDKLESYEPRKFILENLSLEACSIKWNKLFCDLVTNNNTN